ncbi:GntR family transcriptional regulator [Kribbella sp. NPDC056861]|uniref:GntR family transcriptional regulator n=1 Tax=Kribbella sp. NPDC056861 TaxID=3154857 RepID=UPI00342BB60A
MKRAEARDRIVQLIEARGPGQPLPAERALSEALGVSRPTLRAALEDLAQEGLVIRQQGRGTFTGSTKVDQVLAPTQGGRFRAPQVTGSPWRRRLISFDIEPAGARLGQRMEISPGENVISVIRLRLVEDAPMCIERIRIPASLVPGISGEEFEGGSLYELLRSQFGVNPSTAVQTTEATVTDVREAELLGVPTLSPALLFERFTRDQDGRLVEYTTAIYRGDRYRITNNLSFEDAGPAGRLLSEVQPDVMHADNSGSLVS